ncbi:MAG: SRPBCC family protein [Synechococcales cyanobacterium CRU_2_2]|nr:SRPBCC family protein [Synechococcales cyanobacterium CRU_2_2]
MNDPQPFKNSFENSILIRATATRVERCFTEQALMRHWLNPALSCEPVGDWSTAVGSQMQFRIRLPLWQPALLSTVLERQPGLVVWGFEGFFEGRDRWQCDPEDEGTRLLNRFEFEIPNPLIQFGFKTFAATWTQVDMAAQLRRLKQVAERI